MRSPPSSARCWLPLCPDPTGHSDRLLDILLEGMDGYSVYQVFHEDPGTADIPVILVTALSGEIARLNGMVAGAAGFIRKPFAPDDVLRRVQRQLDRARAGSPRTRGPGPGLRP